MIAEKLERTINNFLQQKLIFSVNGKTIKSGKLILFTIKDFYLVFTLSVANTKKIFEIPYPFGFAFNTNKINLDYSITKLSHNLKDIEQNAKQLISKKASKYFNSILEISITTNDI